MNPSFAMIGTLSRNWWLLALCGTLEGMVSVMYMRDAAWRTTVESLGQLMLAAEACAGAAGLWRSAQGKCWPLVLNGIALGALGLIHFFVRFRISVLAIALLFALLATSLGILDIVLARTLPRHSHTLDGWFFALAGVASFGFALSFLALGSGWIALEPGSHVDVLWFGSYFSFSAVCMLVLALRAHRPGPHRQRSCKIQCF